MKEATFIYNPVKNEAHINSLQFNIGDSNRSTWKRMYYLKISKFRKMPCKRKEKPFWY